MRSLSELDVTRSLSTMNGRWILGPVAIEIGPSTMTLREAHTVAMRLLQAGLVRGLYLVQQTSAAGPCDCLDCVACEFRAARERHWAANENVEADRA
jgi:hypothetical protein